MSVLGAGEGGFIQRIEPDSFEAPVEEVAPEAPSSPSTPEAGGTRVAERLADPGAADLRARLEKLLGGEPASKAPSGELEAAVNELKTLLGKSASPKELKQALSRLTGKLGQPATLSAAGLSAKTVKQLKTLHTALTKTAAPQGPTKADAALGSLLLAVDKKVLAGVVKDAKDAGFSELGKFIASAPTLQAHLGKTLDPKDTAAFLKSLVAETGKGKEAGEALSRTIGHVDRDQKPALLRELRSEPEPFATIVISLLHVPDPPAMKTLLSGTCPCNALKTKNTLDRIRRYMDDEADPHQSAADALRAKRGLMDLERFIEEQDDEYKDRFKKKTEEEAT